MYTIHGLVKKNTAGFHPVILPNIQVAIPWLSPHTLQVDHKPNDKVRQMQRHYEQSRLTDRRTDVSSVKRSSFFGLSGAVVFFLIPNPSEEKYSASQIEFHFSPTFRGENEKHM